MNKANMDVDIIIAAASVVVVVRFETVSVSAEVDGLQRQDVLAEGVLHLELVVVVLVVPLGLGGFRRALLDLPFCFFLVVDLCLYRR